LETSTKQKVWPTIGIQDHLALTHPASFWANKLQAKEVS